MKYLLDTHTFIFAAFGSPNLGKQARKIILDQKNELFISVVSFWEISLKYALGKLQLSGVGPEGLKNAGEEMGFSLLGLSVEDASSYHHLPRCSHKDPFDRMLIWQAIQGKYTLVSRDASFDRYVAMGLKVVY